MSLAALQQAVRDELRTELPLLDAVVFPAAKINDIIDLQAGGQPPPAVGQLYLAIHGTDWSPAGAEKEQGIEETFGVAITITRRTPGTPADRQTKNFYLDATIGLDRIARLITPLIHQSYVVLNAANVLIPSGTFKFQEPLRWAGSDAEPTQRDDNWFWATDERRTTTLPTGWTLQCRFGGAVRIQELSAMT